MPTERISRLLVIFRSMWHLTALTAGHIRNYSSLTRSVSRSRWLAVRQNCMIWWEWIISVDLTSIMQSRLERRRRSTVHGKTVLESRSLRRSRRFWAKSISLRKIWDFWRQAFWNCWKILVSQAWKCWNLLSMQGKRAVICHICIRRIV